MHAERARATHGRITWHGMATAPSVKRLASANRTMPGRTEASCLENLKMCISETVAMRHPNPMKHIACMLVDPNFQETLDPTAE